MAGKEMVRSACSWDTPALAVCLWAGCCFAAVQEGPPSPLGMHWWPWGCVGQPLPAGSDPAAAARGCGCSAADRLLLGVVHCRREQGEGARQEMSGRDVCSGWVHGFIPCGVNCCFFLPFEPVFM